MLNDEKELQQQQQQQQQCSNVDEVYYSSSEIDVEEGGEDIREDPEEEETRRRPFPINGSVGKVRKDKEERKMKRRRKSSPYKFCHWFQYTYMNNGYWFNREIYKIVRYDPERLPYLIGTRHRTRNYLEKKFGVKIQIPTHPRYSSIDVYIGGNTNANARERINEALEEIYPMIIPS